MCEEEGLREGNAVWREVTLLDEPTNACGGGLREAGGTKVIAVGDTCDDLPRLHDLREAAVCIEAAMSAPGEVNDDFVEIRVKNRAKRSNPHRLNIYHSSGTVTNGNTSGSLGR